MIIFKTLKWRNFLSTGNQWTEVDFLAHKTNLVVGHNGAGKSTMLDALSFALFGKPHRNINKPQLVNTINNKDCRVEVEFNVAGSSYHIVRGIKPQVFEIYKDGSLINQESHSKGYQKILEQNILKLNHKSFHQIVVLGSSSFIPFMQLTAQARRDVIEDLLDINVYSKMNLLSKEKASILREQMRDIEYRINVADNNIDTQKKYISKINKINRDLRSTKESAIETLRDESKQLHVENTDLVKSIEELNAIWPTVKRDAEAKRTQLLQYQAQFKVDIKGVVKEAKFFDDNNTCPTCSQQIAESLKNDKKDHATKKAKELTAALDKLNDELEQVSATLQEAQTHLNSVSSWQTKLNGNTQTISRIDSEIERVSAEIEGLTDTSGDLNQAKNDLDKMIADKDSLAEERLTNSEQYRYNAAIVEMLKDTGIKTKIVKQYLPAINSLVNQYLQTLDFFVHFNLDDSLSEHIRSRHRDTFSYASFSEGEKQRIDLALLFTWRQIAKMKNSVSTNLLILDETFDSSLDYDGVDNLMKIIYSLDNNTNVFVISHKGDILDGKFDRVIEFVKDQNFSKIK